MKKRIIGIILMCIVFIPILYLGGNIFKFFIAIVGMQALKELINLKNAQKKIPSFVKFLSYVCTAFIILSNFHVDNFTIFMDFRIISILFVFFLIPLIIYSNVDKYNVSDALYLIGIVLLVGFVFNLLLFIRDYDLKRFIFIVSIAMLTDSFAYISGVLSGREKLCPKISPKKSILGLILGVSFGTIVASTLYYVFLNDSINIFLLLSVTLFLSILSQLGDLVFSSIKRYYNVKDFSNIILGHGGVLDRFDSLVFVIIGYIFFISVL